jgi:hypothetical protein
MIVVEVILQKKIQKMKKLILNSLLSLVLLSCGGVKSKIDNINPLGGGEMTAIIDGKDWKASTVQGLGKSTGDQILSVGGVSITAKSGIGVNFDLTLGKVEAGKTYTCGNNTFCEITLDSDATGTNMYYSTDEPEGGATGTVKVDTYDGTNMSGSFSGTLFDSQSKKKVLITNGKFSANFGIL